jgi:hypothetical protein
MKLKPQDYISIQYGRRQRVGSCSFCPTSRCDCPPVGAKILAVNFHGNQFRLCSKCRNALIKVLTNAPNG